MGKVRIKVFPLADVTDAAFETELTMTEGNLFECMTFLNKHFGTELREKGIMILHNGQSLDIHADAEVSDGDQVWVLPRLSGG